MIEIKKIPLSKLHKKEEPLLIKGVIKVLEKHNPKAFRFGDLYDLLVLQMEKQKYWKNITECILLRIK